MGLPVESVFQSHADKRAAKEALEYEADCKENQ